MDINKGFHFCGLAAFGPMEINLYGDASSNRNYILMLDMRKTLDMRRTWCFGTWSLKA